MANQGIYTNTTWVHGVQFNDTSGNPLALVGTYECDVIRRGDSGSPLFTFNTADGTLDHSLQAVGQLVLTATPAQHQPGVPAGSYLLHMRRVDGGATTWAADGRMVVGQPGDRESYIIFDAATDGSTASSVVIAVGGPQGPAGADGADGVDGDAALVAHEAADNPHPQYRSYTPPGTGGIPTTFNIIADRRRYASDFPSLSNAFASLPSTGGELIINDDVAWTSPYQFSMPTTDIANMMAKSNVSIIGRHMPTLNAGKTGFVANSGAIIRGAFFVHADNVYIEGVGFDSGSDFCDANYSGAAQEGLIFFDPQQFGGGATVPTFQHGRIKDVFILGKGTTTSVHALLVENFGSFHSENVHTMYAKTGQCFKSSNVVQIGGSGYGHGEYALLPKSDGYAGGTSNFRSFGFKIGYADTLHDTKGLAVHASSQDMADILVTGLQVSGCSEPFRTITTGAYKIERLRVDYATTNALGNCMYIDGDVRESDIRINSEGSTLCAAIKTGPTGTRVSGYIAGVTTDYCLANEGTGTVVDNLITAEPASGTAGIRQLSGTIHIGVHVHQGAVGVPYIKVSGTITGVTVDGVPETNTDAAAIFGPKSGSMASGGYYTVDFRARNDAGGNIVSGGGDNGAELRIYQPGSGVNKAAIAFASRSSSTTMVEGLYLDDQGNNVFKVNTPGLQATFTANGTAVLEETSTTSIRLRARMSDGVTRSVSFTVS